MKFMLFVANGILFIVVFRFVLIVFRANGLEYKQKCYLRYVSEDEHFVQMQLNVVLVQFNFVLVQLDFVQVQLNFVQVQVRDN